MLLQRLSYSLLFLFLSASFSANGTKLFIPMGANGQTNHLKAYGIAFAAMKGGAPVDWLLNYKGGSFAMDYTKALAEMCKEREVTFTKINDREYLDIVKEIKGLKYDGDVIKLTKAPRIAVYTPLNKEPWDDAVTMALTYAEIPFEKVYAEEALDGKLANYDWLHLHHEDFTGQYGKFWAQFRSAQWYNNDQNTAEKLAARRGFRKVAQMQLAVVKRIAEFVASGGNLFAMCSATDTYDIALAAEGVDICETQFDGDPMDPDAQSKLDFSKCFAFKNFKLITSPYEYEYSDIDNTTSHLIAKDTDVFTLASFPARLDPVPAMLCQNHVSKVKGFMGQTTAFRKAVLKPGVLIMAETQSIGEARYIHGDFGRGNWTFYGGHDPEDYQHAVGAPPTNLAFHRASAGYRLILNNVLSPAAKKVEVPTVVINENKQSIPNIAELDKVPAVAGVSILPDPSTGEVKIVVPRKGDNTTVKVALFNNSGKQVMSKDMDGGSIHINLNDLPEGLYLIQVDNVYVGRIRKD